MLMGQSSTLSAKMLWKARLCCHGLCPSCELILVSLKQLFIRLLGCSSWLFLCRAQEKKEVYFKYRTRLLPPTKCDNISSEEISQLANKDYYFLFFKAVLPDNSEL